LAFVVLVLLYFRFYHSSLPTPVEEVYREVAVEVVGDVRTPGIQTSHHLPTLRQAIEKAGGLKEIHLPDTDSLSEVLETGTLVTVTKEASSPGSAPQVRMKLGSMEAKKLLAFSIPLDLNRASVEDFSLIPGIGESLAREIVRRRERKNGFGSLEELKDVKGIGEKKWQALKPYLVVK